MDDEQLIAGIAASSRALVGIAARAINESGADVTLPQYRALVVLSTRGPQRMAILAEHLGLAPSSVTRLVERLERKHLAERRASPASRREVSVAVSPAGAALVEHVMDHRRKFLAEALATIPKARRVAMLAAFQDFATAVGEPIEVGTFGA